MRDFGIQSRDSPKNKSLRLQPEFVCALFTHFRFKPFTKSDLASATVEFHFLLICPKIKKFICRDSFMFTLFRECRYGQEVILFSSSTLHITLKSMPSRFLIMRLTDFLLQFFTSSHFSSLMMSLVGAFPLCALLLCSALSVKPSFLLAGLFGSG